jgi:hypothetical protein
MEKIDYRKELKSLYRAKADRPVVVDVPPLNFLMLDGRGDPNTAPAFKEAVAALFSLSYALKFRIRKDRDLDYGVLPLEGTWYADDMEAFRSGDRGSWRWTLMIMQPEPVTGELAAETAAELGTKKKLPALGQVRFERLCEGLAAQILHIGAYADEGPTIAGLHEFIVEQGYALRGRHREIYLSDLRRTAPERLKTIIRQPVAIHTRV